MSRSMMFESVLISCFGILFVIAASDPVLDASLKEAAIRGNLSEVISLIRRGANVSAGDSEGMTALHWSSRYGKLEIVEYLVEKGGADVNTRDHYHDEGLLPIHHASHNGYINVVRYLVDHGASVDVKTNDGRTPLYIASLDGYLQVVQYLVEKGANIHNQTDDGQTALYISSQIGNIDVVKYLVEKGADIFVKEKHHGRTALYISSRKGNLDIVEYLVGKGANVNEKANDGRTALYAASQYGHLIVVEYLLEMGANVNEKQKDGWTSLHAASQNGHLEVVQYLIDKGVDVNAIQKNGATALHMATQSGHLEIVKYLVQKGLNADIKTSDGRTALFISAQTGRLNIAKFLVENGADISARNRQGLTAQDIASRYGKTDIVEMLRNARAPGHATPTTTTTARPNPTADKNRIAVIACERYSVLPVGYIISGSPASPGEYPWMAALVYVNTYNYSHSFDCGGTIISDRYVLTAAHCMKSRPPVIIRVGKLSLTDENDDRAVNYHVENIIKHPGWLSIRRKNDIALIRVTQRIEFNDFVTPACLHTDLSDLNLDTKLIVTGWGTTSTDRVVISNNLRAASLISTPLQNCNATFLKYNEKAKFPAFENGVSESQYCAHDPVNNSDSCYGDSGGPLQYFPSDNSLGHVVGVVSFGIDCGTELPGIYTRVAYYLDWIETIVWPNLK